VDFWVQVHNLPVGLMAEKVGKKLANYIGSFVEYDKNNNTSIWRQYMRLRVRVDVHQPLKKESKVKNQGGEWCIIKFKYERLGVFCFVCGIMGHAENKCEVRFAKEIDDGVREWSNELRAEPRRRSGRQTSRWLKEEGGGSGNSNGGERNQVDNNSGGPIHNHDVINEVNNNHNHTIIVPHVTPTNNHQIPNPSSQSAIQTDLSIYQLSNQTHQHLMSFNVLSQPLLIHDQQPINTNQHTDNSNEAKLLAIHEPVPSFQFTTAAALKTQSILSDTRHMWTQQKQFNIPLNRSIKINPTQTLNRTNPKNKPTRPKPKLI
jgi:hypothetical protein